MHQKLHTVPYEKKHPQQLQLLPQMDFFMVDQYAVLRIFGIAKNHKGINREGTKSNRR